MEPLGFEIGTLELPILILFSSFSVPMAALYGKLLGKGLKEAASNSFYYLFEICLEWLFVIILLIIGPYVLNLAVLLSEAFSAFVPLNEIMSEVLRS